MNKREVALGACVLLLVLFLAWLQAQSMAQKGGSRPEQPSPDLLLNARYAVGARQLVGPDVLDRQLEMVTRYDQATRAADRLRLAILRGELSGAEAARQALAPLAEVPEVKADVVLLQRIFGSEGSTLSEAERHELEARHGWFGRLALSYGLPPSDPLRAGVLASAKLTVWVFVLLLGLISMFMIVGSFLFFWSASSYHRGRLRLLFQPTPLGDGDHGVVLLEVLVWLLALIPLQGQITRMLPMVLAPLAQVSMLGLLVWVRWRLGSWTGVADALGWTRGAGIFRELGAGLVGYVTGFPVLCLGLLATLVLTSFTAVAPTHPITYQFEHATPLQLILLFFMASLGAPLVEETFFRGAFFHFLRGRFRFLGAALLQGLVFAAIHPQGWAALPVLTTIGIVFAGIREWRGSLIAPMAAHALNNTLVMVLSLLLLR